MTCPLCADHGVIRVRYRDGSLDDFGICRCDSGQILRSDRNAVGRPTGIPAWQIWAAREGVAAAQVCLVEELLDDADLARVPDGEAPTKARSSIADAMRTQRPRL